MANFCGGEAPDYTLLECGFDAAGIIAAAYIENSLTPTKSNLEDASWWTTNMATSPNVVWVLTKTRGSKDAASPVTQVGFGKENTRTTGAEHNVTFEHEGLEENRDFIQALNERTDLNFLYVTSGFLFGFVEDVDNYASPVINEDTKQLAFWRHTVNWQNFDVEIIGNAPQTIFDV